MATVTFPGPDTIQQFDLANGLRVLIYENYAVDLVVVDGLWRAGGLSVGRDKAGLADLTASMLLRGTRQRSFGAIYEQLESVGASLYFSSGRHTSEFGGNCLSEDLDLVLGLASEALMEPVFPEDQLERLKAERLTALQIRANDTRSVAGRAFRELLYGMDHPYSISLGGYPETLANLTRADVVSFHEQHYGPKDGIITIVGAIKAEDAVAMVEAAFGKWENHDQIGMPEVNGVDRPVTINRVYKPLNDKTQTDIVLGWPGPQRSQPDYLHASLANTVLGVFGMMGRLGKSVREEQGLAYYASSRLQSGIGPSPWLVSTGVSPDKVDQAIESIRAEVRRMQDELVPADELADCKAYRTGSLPVSLETNDGLAGIIMDMEYLGLGNDYLYRFSDLFNDITAEDVQKAAQTYLDADAMALAIAGPPEA